MATEFESRTQNLVYQLEVGVGANVLKALLYVLFMVLVALLFMARQYQGFRVERAMDQAQVGVQIAKNGSMDTRVVRPGSIRHLRETRTFQEAKPGQALAVQPELHLEPGYPHLLGAMFRLTGTDFKPPDSTKFAPERGIVFLNLAMVFLAGLFTFLIGLRLFSPRVALTALTMFFLSGTAFHRAVEGTEAGFALLLFTFSVWCGLQVVSAWEKPGAGALARWLPLLSGAIALALLVLTRYAAAVAVPGFLLFLFLGLRRKAWIPALVVVGGVAVALTPWVLRNLDVSDAPFGLAPSAALEQSAGDLDARRLTPPDEREFGEVFRSSAIRIIRAVQHAFTFEDSPLGSGIVFCLFIATFFYSFQRKSIGHLRWMILFSYLLLTVVAGIFGLPSMEAAFVFFPLVTLLGTAFFYLLLDRLKIPVKLASLSVVAVFILFQSLPLLTAMTSPKPYPYPPYNARAIHMFTEPFEAGELFCTDIPWATAWYGGQTSLYLPASVDDFFFIHDRIQPIKGLYFTMATRNLPYHTQLRQGPYREWMPIMERDGLPRGFPLSFYMPISNGEQIIYADSQSRFYPEGP